MSAAAWNFPGSKQDDSIFKGGVSERTGVIAGAWEGILDAWSDKMFEEHTPTSPEVEVNDSKPLEKEVVNIVKDLTRASAKDNLEITDAVIKASPVNHLEFIPDAPLGTVPLQQFGSDNPVASMKEKEKKSTVELDSRLHNELFAFLKTKAEFPGHFMTYLRDLSVHNNILIDKDAVRELLVKKDVSFGIYFDQVNEIMGQPDFIKDFFKDLADHGGKDSEEVTTMERAGRQLFGKSKPNLRNPRNQNRNR